MSLSYSFCQLLLLPSNRAGRRRRVAPMLWETSSSFKGFSKSGAIFTKATSTFQGEGRNVQNIKMLQKVRDNTEKHYNTS